LSNRSNNFDFVRIVAALAVVATHCFPIHDNFEAAWDLGAAAVNAFFAISGYLVMGSWERDPHVVRFLWRRIVRIFPALIAAVFLSALVIGLASTSLPWKRYLLHPATRDYLFTVTLIPVRYFLPGVFESNPLKTVVNGSLWTLPYEFACYLTMAALGLITLLRKRWSVPTVWMICAAWFVYSTEYPDHHFGPYLDKAPSMIICFATGMLAWKLRTRIPFVASSMPVTAAAILYWRGSVVETYLLSFAVSYAAIAIAVKSWPGFRRAGRFGDFSYGVYIYAFPLQQWLMHAFPGLSVWGLMLWSVAISVAVGALSWHFIEKPALAKKDLFGSSTREQTLRAHQKNSNTPI
jgi:peptidoglycan/LPS O-acetylase OafA/YrhL